MNKSNFDQEVAGRIEVNFDDCPGNPERKKIWATWFDENTADYWRHQRAYAIADCFVHKTEATWLTVGDGRFGLDSIRLKKRGIANVLPSDACDSLLKIAKQKGLISDYSIQNVEDMTFRDESFDFVFCKESYHHFSKPMIGLYEMLRVAGEAVFLVEPNDQFMAINPLLTLKTALKRILHRNTVYAAYETDGNYIYSISEREIEKAALGANLPHVIFKGLNNGYIKGVEFEPADLIRSKLFRKVRWRVFTADLLCLLRLRTPAMLMAGIIKKPLDRESRRKLLDTGWRIIDLPRNPYATGNHGVSTHGATGDILD